MPDNGSLRPGFAATQRSRVRRHPERAHHDRETVYAILDAAMMCHVGYVIDGLPYVTPTLFWRDGERLYWHGSSASRMLRAQREGIPVYLTVSHVDGLVLGRCAFRHSLNYRAVMAFRSSSGEATVRSLSMPWCSVVVIENEIVFPVPGCTPDYFRNDLANRRECQERLAT